MKRYLPVILCLAGVLRQAAPGFAQGCSDAGFCTINSFRAQAADTTSRPNLVKAGISFGAADQSITAIAGYVEYSRMLGERFSADVKAAALGQSGNGIAVSGLSDIYVTANYKAGKTLKMTVGIKLPLSDGNNFYDGLPLPMDYQSSLGTTDLLAGAGFSLGKTRWVAAVQQPLTQNSNTFLAENMPAGSPLREFQSTNRFERNGDVLLRVSLPLRIQERLTLTPGLLPIYHLANDHYTDATMTRREIAGSQGLTLNANIYLDAGLGNGHAMQLIVGAPLVVRDARPDGLTRSFLVNLEYRVNF
jgi:hypothetical protein